MHTDGVVRGRTASWLAMLDRIQLALAEAMGEAIRREEALSAADLAEASAGESARARQRALERRPAWQAQAEQADRKAARAEADLDELEPDWRRLAATLQALRDRSQESGVRSQKSAPGP